MQLVLWWRVPIGIGIQTFQQLLSASRRIWIAYKKWQNSRLHSIISPHKIFIRPFHLDSGELIMTSLWRRCSVRLPSFVASPITRCTSVAARTPLLPVSTRTSRTMPSWWGAAALTLYVAASGIANPLTVANIFNAWKRSWASAMPSIQCRRGKLRKLMELLLYSIYWSISCGSKNQGPKLNMYSNRNTGPGSLKMELHTEATVRRKYKLAVH